MSAEAYEKTYNYLRDGTRIRADDINGNDESLLVNSISLTNEILGSADYKYSNQANIVSTSVTAIYNVNQFFKEYNEKDANGYSKGFVR